MKTINIFLFSILFLTNIAQADEKLYSFIGVQTSATNYDGKNTPTLGLRYGKQSQNFRTSFSYNYGKHSKDSYHTLLLEMDSGIFSETFSSSLFRPYLGGAVGMIEHINSKDNDRGYLFGINTGLTYLFNENIDFDLNYRFLRSAKLKDLDTINELTFAMHYFY